MPIEIYSKIRPTKEYSKNYIKQRLEDFVDIYPLKTQINPERVTRIEFCKQDMRGVPSISLYDNKSCIIEQRHFKTYNDMLQYIIGYTDAS
jgi:hypothetical protein